MLIQYSVKNYKSIKDEIVINFSCLDKDTKENYLVINEKEPIYKMICLVGPNASGKTNVLDSLYFALRFIASTIKRKDSSQINVEPFLLDNESRSDSTTFEFIFLEDGIKYVYGFSVNRQRVVEEYLLGYYSKKATTVFDRDSSRSIEYDFKGNDVKKQTEISQKTNANRLYLPVAAEWGYEKVKPAYKWFERMNRRYGNIDKSQIIEKILGDKAQKAILIDALKKADFNISNIYVKKRKMQKQQRDAVIAFLRMLGDSDLEEFSIPEERPVINITHKGVDNHEYSLEFSEDSAGTQSIIDNIAEYLYVNKEGGLIIEDELGKNFHTKLTEYFIHLFNEEKYNDGKAQMIFSTHDTSVLKQKILSPEQIYLVDKDEQGGTFVKLLDDYLIREKDNIELGYLKGRYGAIPNIKG